MRKLFYTLILLITFSCVETSKEVTITNNFIEEGVSLELAKMRKENIKDVRYKLHFNLPQEIDSLVTGSVDISFLSSKKIPVIIDFFAPKENILSVTFNGEEVDYDIMNQHIIIPNSYCKIGENIAKVDFISPNRSLNRREEFMYTLLVPDRARTLFPLFEQPDIKAKYTLSLTLPKSWSGIANSGEVSKKSGTNGYKTISFKESEPISSYLFSFVAGEFDYTSDTRNGREHRIYHRERDEANLAQLDDIMKELFHSLDWLEEYTDIEYPFSKYDMVLIPGFQYGGMEHIGATIYKASTMFLSPTPTIDQRISRAKLVAHETAHMWFGDYVTMEWFDDVWTKEVFANYFAAKIISPLFKELDEKQGMLSYFANAYSEDRTVGGTSIKQDLDNLKYAGLVYNSIIYNKSPLVLGMIAEKLGEKSFRRAVRETLKTYAFDNASWEEWVEIFDKHSKENITEWSHNWMYKSGMPHVTITNQGNKVIVEQQDPKGRGLTWGQDIAFRAISSSGEEREYKVSLEKDTLSLTIDFVPQYIIPNSDGNGYGYFRMSKESGDYLMKNLAGIKSSVERRMALINLYDNVLHNNIGADDFIRQLLINLPKESDQLLYSTMLQYISGIYKTYLKPRCGEKTYEKVGKEIEDSLWSIFEESGSAGIKATTFKTLYNLMPTNETADRMYDYWSGKKEVKGITLGTRDLMDMSLKLSIYYPKRAKDITAEQLAKIENRDMKSEYLFVSQAVQRGKKEREEFFNSLKDEKNREVESWTQKALSLLIQERKGDNSRDSYIKPALELLPEIQRTGDIFFPAQWCSSLLIGNNSYEAYREVDSFLKANPNLHPMLKSKLLIAADHLYRLHDGDKNK